MQSLFAEVVSGSNPLLTVATISVAMAVLAFLEAVIPLQRRSAWSRAHLAPNLTLTLITFATNLVLNAMLVAALVWMSRLEIGLLSRVAWPLWLATSVMVLGLDFSFYVAHVAMHKIPLLWRFHRVHHSDPAVDVTTTIRQHPGEGVIRYLFLAAFAIPIGVTPSAFAIYRLWSALVGLIEHANLRLSPRIDNALSLVFTWPNVHKIHHSRDVRFTNTNYSNLVSIWDRLGGTFTPARKGADISYGLDGLDDEGTQTLAGLLVLPFRKQGRELTPVSTSRSVQPSTCAALGSSARR